MSEEERDAEQAWFWTDAWQKKEREVDIEIAAGRVWRFDNAEDFIAYLDASAKAYDAALGEHIDEKM